MVGAVIVYQNQIIGEGYHQYFGGPHAEVNAIESVENKDLLKEASIYVSLEPCSHFGKTPPCSDLIIKYRLKRVVIACVDSFAQVSGAGIEKLKKAGVDVTIGVLEQEARSLNKRFFTFHEQKRPYVILKWAQSADGYIDRLREEDELGVFWITQKETKQLTHQWRSEESAILIGKNTALNDNPRLTVREVDGKNPIRILLDSHLEVPSTNLLFSDDAPSIIFNTKFSKIEGTNQWIQLIDMNPKTILNTLFKLEIQSVIIEGGKAVLTSFIDANCWDEARILTGNKSINRGLKAPKLNQTLEVEYKYGEDTIQVFKLPPSLPPRRREV